MMAEVACNIPSKGRKWHIFACFLQVLSDYSEHSRSRRGDFPVVPLPLQGKVAEKEALISEQRSFVCMLFITLADVYFCSKLFT